MQSDESDQKISFIIIPSCLNTLLGHMVIIFNYVTDHAVLFIYTYIRYSLSLHWFYICALHNVFFNSCPFRLQEIYIKPSSVLCGC